MSMNVGIEVSFEDEGKLVVKLIGNKNHEKKAKRKTGNSLLNILDEFTVIDIETTGLYPQYDEILEIGAIKCRYNNVIDTFHSFVALESKDLYLKDDNYPLNIHGNITVGMLRDAPEIKEVLTDFLRFIEDDVVIAHNAYFDVSFIYDKAEKYLDVDFSNDYVDTLRLTRRLFPEVPNHKLATLCEELNLDKPDHRSLADCYAAFELYSLCCNKCIKENIELKCRDASRNNNNYIPISYKESVAIKNKTRNCEDTNIDTDNPLYNKTVVFTGTLENLIRKDAAQLVINLGGSVSDSVNKNTNYLVMGIQDYSKFADGKESSKTKKAKQLIQNGQDLKIIDENEFIKLTSLKLQEG